MQLQCWRWARQPCYCKGEQLRGVGWCACRGHTCTVHGGTSFLQAYLPGSADTLPACGGGVPRTCWQHSTVNSCCIVAAATIMMCRCCAICADTIGVAQVLHSSIDMPLCGVLCCAVACAVQTPVLALSSSEACQIMQLLSAQSCDSPPDHTTEHSSVEVCTYANHCAAGQQPACLIGASALVGLHGWFNKCSSAAPEGGVANQHVNSTAAVACSAATLW
jgi:hypothetical protein